MEYGRGKVKSGKMVRRFIAKDGREFTLRIVQEGELNRVRKLFTDIYREGDSAQWGRMAEKRRLYPSLFVGCFDNRKLVGAVVGWPEPKILAVHGIAVLEDYRRKGIGTALLESFDNAAEREGFDNFVLGAQWEAVPFYTSYGLSCFANAQIKPESIPWERIQTLRSKYKIIASIVFGPSPPSELVQRLARELKVSVGTVKSDFESVSIQISPTEISKEALKTLREDLNAYSTQFCFKKRL
ncbi:MAG: GNAT family N-acetyltransferase [Candidatus Bathyarchaeota archaeon]|nr:GNAT family N-acetyltransferase [Candidatus Bathyarchaeota archaeon]